METIKKIKGLDAQLSPLDFDVQILIKAISLSITGDRDDIFVPSQTLLEFAIDNQAIKLEK